MDGRRRRKVRRRPSAPAAASVPQAAQPGSPTAPAPPTPPMAAAAPAAAPAAASSPAAAAAAPSPAARLRAEGNQFYVSVQEGTAPIVAVTRWEKARHLYEQSLKESITGGWAGGRRALQSRTVANRLGSVGGMRHPCVLGRRAGTPSLARAGRAPPSLRLIPPAVPLLSGYGWNMHAHAAEERASALKNLGMVASRLRGVAADPGQARRGDSATSRACMALTGLPLASCITTLGLRAQGACPDCSTHAPDPAHPCP